jgi:hypothetical protein
MTARFPIRRIRFKSPREWGPGTYIVLAIACAIAYPFGFQQSSVPSAQDLRVIEDARWVLTRHGKQSGVTFFDKSGHAKGSWFVASHEFNRDIPIFAYIDSLPSAGTNAKISVDRRPDAQELRKVWRAEIGGREVYSWQRAVEIHWINQRVTGWGVGVFGGVMVLLLLSMLKLGPASQVAREGIREAALAEADQRDGNE